jgi:hypothetical protein
MSANRRTIYPTIGNAVAKPIPTRLIADVSENNVLVFTTAERGSTT